jgi:hypothetical protein
MVDPFTIEGCANSDCNKKFKMRDIVVGDEYELDFNKNTIKDAFKGFVEGGMYLSKRDSRKAARLVEERMEDHHNLRLIDGKLYCKDCNPD